MRGEAVIGGEFRMDDCIFCRIAKGDIPSKKVFENERIFAFHDINPQAPVHVLIIPKEHIRSMDEVLEEHLNLMGEIQGIIRKIAKELGLDNGYRIVNNCGEEGGQEVLHLHYHLLGGRKMKWPPG